MANSLSSCVSSLRSTNALLSSSISILDSGVNDFPRLAKVLQTTRHFELLSEPTLHEAQSSLLASLTPEVSSLLSRVEAHLDKLARREQALIARTELLEGRIGEGRTSMGDPRSSGAGQRSSVGMSGDSSREALRLKQLRGKKERLSYAVERLTLQAQQKERQLRQSIAGH
ncbi:DASH complex subunit spc19 [Lecanora helva]